MERENLWATFHKASKNRTDWAPEHTHMGCVCCTLYQSPTKDQAEGLSQRSQCQPRSLPPLWSSNRWTHNRQHSQHPKNLCRFTMITCFLSVNSNSVNVSVMETLSVTIHRILNWKRLKFLPGESPWTEEPGSLQSMKLQRGRHDWATNAMTEHRRMQWLYALFYQTRSLGAK